MLYFIPAWYQKDQWCESEQKWYVRRMQTEFDDTVKQLQLFHRNGVWPWRPASCRVRNCCSLTNRLPGRTRIG